MFLLVSLCWQRCWARVVWRSWPVTNSLWRTRGLFAFFFFFAFFHLLFTLFGSFLRTSFTFSLKLIGCLFNRFWRSDRARSREQGGSGLGLAIARQLIEAQGGQIGVESDGVPGRGSRFWFTLPVIS